MHSRSITSFILSTFIVTAAKCGSHFELIKSSEQQIGGQGSVSGMFLHKTHFQCDREYKCTHVIKREGSNKYIMVYGEDALKKMTDTAIIWKKIAISASHGNIALGKPSVLSSLWKNHTIASRAVDGSTDTYNCAESKFEDAAWLRVDLQAAAVVLSVTIFSLETEYRHMKAIDIRAGNIFEDGGIGNPPCQLNVAIPAYSKSLHVHCPADMIARYITVNGQESGIIEICEIEVYGYYV